MNYVGITERGDAGLNFDWVKRLYEANIIISKNINNKLIKEVIAHKEKIILHVTCTGWGGTELEPNVPAPEITRKQVEKLIADGFPVNQIVLRIDPIIPTERGLMILDLVLQEFGQTGIKRCRYSFLDMYDHVKERFTNAEIELPYESFHAPKEMMYKALDVLEVYKGSYDFESCAEVTEHKVGCISNKDLDILQIHNLIPVVKEKKPRFMCACLGNKKELILSDGGRCPHKCLYCFWKD